MYILFVFHFENCKNEDVDIEVDDGSFEEELFDEEIDKTKQNFILSQKSDSFLCILEFQSSHSILSKLLENVLPKRTFLIHTDTLMQKVGEISKDYTLNWFVQEMGKSNGFG